MKRGSTFGSKSWPKKKRKATDKYSNAIRTVDGYSFHSKLESNLYLLLKLMEKAGEIKEIKTQDSVHLTESKILYKPDFKVFNVETGTYEWHEAKGFETSDWRIKRRLWKNYGPGTLHIWKAGRGQEPYLHETLHSKMELK